MKIKKKNIIILLAIIILIILALIFITKKYSNGKKLILSGTIESTQIDVNSEVTGKVVEILKDEGDTINAGEAIVRIDSKMQELVVKQFEALVKFKKAKLAELEIGTRSEDIDQAEASLESAETNSNYWKDKHERIKTIYESGNTSEMEYLDVKYKMETANQELKKARSRLNLLIKGSTYQTIKAAEADFEQSKAQLDQAKVTLNKFSISSNIDGTYLYRNIEVGDIVNVGTSIATISDLSDLWVKLYIPQMHIGKIKLNQIINMKSRAIKNEIEGRIKYIANEAEFTPKNTETNEAKENTVFKIKVKITNNIKKLKPGMTVDAFISFEDKNER